MEIIFHEKFFTITFHYIAATASLASNSVVQPRSTILFAKQLKKLLSLKLISNQKGTDKETSLTIHKLNK